MLKPLEMNDQELWVPGDLDPKRGVILGRGLLLASPAKVVLQSLLREEVLKACEKGRFVGWYQQGW